VILFNVDNNNEGIIILIITKSKGFCTLNRLLVILGHTCNT